MVYRDPAISRWVPASKCPLLSQHLLLQPPMCLELGDRLASTFPGAGVGGKLDVIWPVKKQRSS